MLDVHPFQPVRFSYPSTEFVQPSPQSGRRPGQLDWLHLQQDPQPQQQWARPSSWSLRRYSPHELPFPRLSPGRAHSVAEMHGGTSRLNGPSASQMDSSVPYEHSTMMGQSNHHHPPRADSSYLRSSVSRHSYDPPRSSLPSKPASPVIPHAPPPDQDGRTKSAASSQQNNAVAEYLQLPSTISKSHGSLAEFAAQITCLFWFESSGTLSHIENSQQTPYPTSRLVPEAFPATGFLKWVTTILSTTQVSQVVILLALLFVYRLKKQNPSVKGKPGSEYRLLTVALMLGNKFLDDNTYTNRTWAEVSGISVHEIHVMEVEFLSHMKYNLYTSGEEWRVWHEKLSKFWTYFDRASRKLSEVSLNPPILRTGSNPHMPHALPSPPASSSASPPFASSNSASPSDYPNAQALPHQLAPISISPTAQLPELDPRIVNGRKRSYDEALEEPPAKRSYTHYSSAPIHVNSQYPQQYQQPTPLPNLPNLPIPHLPLPASRSGANTPASQMALSGGRNTPTSTAVPTSNWLHGVYSNSSYPIHADSFGPTSSHLSNSRQPTPVAPIPSSSMTPSYPSATPHTASSSQLSPSHFLIQRTSPYRPVRNISTLLVPPPPSSIENPSNSISYEQMHWQPLSKNANERRTGRVPYIHRGEWPPVHHVEQYQPMYSMNMPGQ